MAVNKSKIIKNLQESITLSVQPQKFLSYSDYVYRTPVFSSLFLYNKSEQDITNVTVTLSAKDDVCLPKQKTFEQIPYAGNVPVVFDGVFSPVYFVDKQEIDTATFCVTVEKDKQVLASQEVTSTVLPFDWWCGLGGDIESLSGFVRPKLSSCEKALQATSEQLSAWKFDNDVSGYDMADKNQVRNIIAALFMAVKRLDLVKDGENDFYQPTLAGGVGVTKGDKVNSLSLAVFFAACLERAKLHPVILLGGNHVACGVWLYDSCLLDGVSDDMQFIGKYTSDGINNISMFDVEDLFGDKSLAYSTAEGHFAQKLQSNLYEAMVDVRRCRLDNVFALPLRTQGVKGYELLGEKEMSSDAPDQLVQLQKPSLEEKLQKNKIWERRLLDLSLKNTLLNFDLRRGLHVISCDVDKTFAAVTGEEMRLAAVDEGKSSFLPVTEYGRGVDLKQKAQLIELEQENGICRLYSNAGDLGELSTRFIRQAREAAEESGTQVLYLAMGFLKWICREDGKIKYAPLVLQPVEMKKLRGENVFTLRGCDAEFNVNATLMEYLKQEFNVDIRGLGEKVSQHKVSQILAMVKMEIKDKKGWDVYDDVCISTFSFASYLMWNDIRSNISLFKNNPLVSSLLDNKNELGEGPAEELDEDSVSPMETLTPLVADAAQYDAIALASHGKSFVLHGPPGTGKSQTITNIIANALYQGKRVLFVAEKQAALNVVKKRLDGIGIGDFCLELHSGKADKSEVVKKIETTLALANVALGDEESREKAEAERQEQFKLSADDIVRMKKIVNDPFSALHKKRRLGLSFYESILLYLENKSAPDVMNVESAFYDGLTKEKLAEYERLLTVIAASARECGGVYNSPFQGVEKCEYSPALRDGVYCASEVLLTEIKHLKNCLGLVLDLYRQRVSVLTRKKTELLKELLSALKGNELDNFFFLPETELYVFYNANKRLDDCLKTYNQTFRSLIDIKKEYPFMGVALESDGDYKSNKTLVEVVKKLKRVAISPVREENWSKYLQLIYDIHTSLQTIEKSELSKNFLSFFGGIDHKKRLAYLQPLYHMHAVCAELFMDYNADSFNSMCNRAREGVFLPALYALEGAIAAFEQAEDKFLFAIGGKKSDAKEDLLEYYTAKAGALIDNVDMLASWCNYKATAKTLDENGLRFICDAMENGKLGGEELLSAFRKNVYKNFLDINLPADGTLASFSAAAWEQTVEQMRLGLDSFAEKSKEMIRYKLISRLPKADTEGALSVEMNILTRLLKGKLRGVGVRAMLEQAPSLMKVVSPCLLMSPLTVSQYLQPTVDFDLVIFDEASQLPTSEAVGALARAQKAVIVGDPKQLPPTTFFTSVYVDEDNMENEDMESVLDDYLALGIPQRYLQWHYRSKHESLIAFSNNMYYDGKLCTFPSPDSLESKVRLRLVDGYYDRGATKRNEAEADALVEEVVRRLKDPVLCKQSIGVVTFSTVQMEFIERKMAKALAENKLDEVAYDRDEGLFVKNLENVQGDERDVILFSVCYGPDKKGAISLNFGPLNQAGGWRRLNVAVSRAREEMIVFSSMTSNQIDLTRTKAKGVVGLKAFLEFAQKGRTSLAVNGTQTVNFNDIGKYVAQELTSLGYDVRRNVGASSFKIDVGIVDPNDKSRFILGIMLDGGALSSVKDRTVLQIRTLKRANWNILRLFTVNFYNNPKREIKKVKETLDKLTGGDKKSGTLSRNQKPYTTATLTPLSQNAAYVNDLANTDEICSRLRKIVAAEEPVWCESVKRRCLASLGVTKYGSKVEERMDTLLLSCGFHEEKILSKTYIYKTEKAVSLSKYRVCEDGKIKEDPTPYDLLCFIKSVLGDKVTVYVDELVALAKTTFGIQTVAFEKSVNDCISLGEERGLFVRSVSDRITLA